MFSINPLFPDQVMGGAPKHLQNIATHLGHLGHQVTVLCTQRADTSEPFKWGPNVDVLPVLRFKQPFPQPYAAPAYDLAAAFQDVAEHLAHADRFYMHDGELLFPPVFRHVPTVVSLRDNVYPETILGSFLFQGDTLIAISEYSRQLYLSTAGRFFPELDERMRVIPNGIDWEHFKPTAPTGVLDYLSVNPERDVIVLHPHRPEPSKGLEQTVEVADRLVHQYGMNALKVLVPRWLDTVFSADLRAYYEGIQQRINERGLQDHFIFHEWLPQELMPQYYSLGAITLALGHFVEAFGNAVYESLGCGTPAITARVATHRELLPDDLLNKVHFGDVNEAAYQASEIIREGRRTGPATLEYLHAHYGVKRQLTAYAETILNARTHPELQYRFNPIGPETCFRLAPWCYEWEGGFFHDFNATHVPITPLSTLLNKHPAGFSYADAQAAGVSLTQVNVWYRDGYLIPMQSETLE